MEQRKTPVRFERKHRKAKKLQVADPPPAVDITALLEEQARAAGSAYSATPHDPMAFSELRAAVERYCLAANEPFSVMSWDTFEWLEIGDHTNLRAPVAYLEADPWHHGSGYRKTDVIRILNRQAIPDEYARRLRRVVLAIVDTRDAREFRSYCRLARHIDAPDLRGELEIRLDHADPNVRRRARWVLDALGG